MIHITKANGQEVPFDEEKVINSIKRARIPASLQSTVLSHVKGKLYEGITTNEIYHHISEFLGQSEEPYHKTRYGLKQAIMMLGPTGFPFEDYAAEIFFSQGYTVKLRQILMGKCVSHEIDILAEKNKKRSLIEVKFHNSPGTVSDVHVPMYTKSRFEDVREKHSIDDAWIVTNTKTTSDAVAFAQCVHMKTLSWSYPEGNSLRDLIEQHHLYPVTALTGLTLAQKAQLLARHVVLCREICANHNALNFLNLSKIERENVLAEIEFVCDIKDKTSDGLV